MPTRDATIKMVINCIGSRRLDLTSSSRSYDLGNGEAHSLFHIAVPARNYIYMALQLGDLGTPHFLAGLMRSGIIYFKKLPPIGLSSLEISSGHVGGRYRRY